MNYKKDSQRKFCFNFSRLKESYLVQCDYMLYMLIYYQLNEKLPLILSSQIFLYYPLLDECE